MSGTPKVPPQSYQVLQNALKRCSLSTYKAALRFRKTGDLKAVPTIVHGVIERYLEPQLRPRLKQDNDSLRLKEDLAIDSLSLIEIVMVVEDVLQISIENEELCRLGTLGEVKAFMAEKLSLAARSACPA